MKKHSAKRKWLIYWDWANDASAVVDQVVGILDPRYGEDRIKLLVSFIYKQAHLTLEEMASAKRNDYQAERHYDGRITCGRNPELNAEIAEILRVARDPETGFETITWIPHYHAAPYKDSQGNLQVSKSQPPQKRFIRLKTGPICYELLKDWKRGGHT